MKVPWVCKPDQETKLQPGPYCKTHPSVSHKDNRFIVLSKFLFRSCGIWNRGHIEKRKREDVGGT